MVTFIDGPRETKRDVIIRIVHPRARIHANVKRLPKGIVTRSNPDQQNQIAGSIKAPRAV